MTLAVDAGGTYLRAKIFNDNKFIKELSAKSAKSGLSFWIESILKKDFDIKTVCISYAGQVKDGVIISAPNIQIDKHDIKSYFEKKYSIKLFIENDLNCAVLAEASYFNESDICAVYIGTGLGLGVVSSSKLISGFNGVATELGHIPYKEAPFKCGCGKNNCIELFASGSALDKWQKYVNIESALSLAELKNTPELNEIYDKFEKALLYAVATTITLFNPKVIVLGGGIIESNPQLCTIISTKIEDYAMPSSLQGIKIIDTNLKDAPLQGAIMLKEER